ncbi:MAG: hypothetical protein V1726_00425 [Methanobacteriota archaeon]
MIDVNKAVKQLNEDALYERFINKGNSEWKAKTEASFFSEKI